MVITKDRPHGPGRSVPMYIVVKCEDHSAIQAPSPHVYLILESNAYPLRLTSFTFFDQEQHARLLPRHGPIEQERDEANFNVLGHVCRRKTRSLDAVADVDRQNLDRKCDAVDDNAFDDGNYDPVDYNGQSNRH